MPVGPKHKYTKPCKHRHLSGRDCKQRVGRQVLTGTFPDPVLCELHRVPCAECRTMASAFGLELVP